MEITVRTKYDIGDTVRVISKQEYEGREIVIDGISMTVTTCGNLASGIDVMYSGFVNDQDNIRFFEKSLMLVKKTKR